MKKMILSLTTAAFMMTLSFAGDKNISPVVAPVSVVDEADKSCWYIGVGGLYNRVYSTDSGWFDDSKQSQDETLGFAIVAGCDYHENLAIEGRFTSAFDEREYADPTTFSIFLKPKYPINERFTIYGLVGLGYTHVEGVEADNGSGQSYRYPGETILGKVAFHWGLGLSYNFTDSFSVFFDYTDVANDLDIDNQQLYGDDATYYDKLSVDGLTFGFIYHF